MIIEKREFDDCFGSYALSTAADYQTISVDNRILGHFNIETVSIIKRNGSHNSCIYCCFNSNKQISKKYRSGEKFSDYVSASIVLNDADPIDVYELVEFDNIDQISDFFAIHNLDFREIVDSYIEDFVESDRTDSEGRYVKLWKDLRNKYDDIVDWQEDLTNISDGFDNIYENELEHIVSNFADLSFWLSALICDNMKKEFFNYGESSVADLSVVNDVHIFRWNVNFMNLSFDAWVDEFFGKLF